VGVFGQVDVGAGKGKEKRRMGSTRPNFHSKRNIDWTSLGTRGLEMKKKNHRKCFLVWWGSLAH